MGYIDRNCAMVCHVDLSIQPRNDCEFQMSLTKTFHFSNFIWHPESLVLEFTGIPPDSLLEGLVSEIRITGKKMTRTFYYIGKYDKFVYYYGHKDSSITVMFY